MKQQIIHGSSSGVPVTVLANVRTTYECPLCGADSEGESWIISHTAAEHPTALHGAHR